MGKKIYLVCFILLAPSLAFAQWTKILDLGDGYLLETRFYEGTTGTLLNGVALFAGYKGQVCTVFLTSDGGNTWIEASNISLQSGYQSIAFKSPEQFWLFGGLGTATGDYPYLTSDFGATWSTLTSIKDFTGGAFYSSSTKLLFWSGGSNAYYSSDDGQTWVSFITNLSREFPTGFAYSDYSSILLTGGSTLSYANNYYLSNDGGLTWNKGSILDESFQPLAIKETSTYLTISEITNNILRSDDKGKTWDTIATFPQDYSLSGCIVGDLCHLYVQFNGNGTWESTDQGRTWTKITDLGGYRDTRFYFYNNRLFIGGTPHYTPPIQSGSFWRYDLPPNKPTILADNFLLSTICGIAKDTTIPIAAINQCDGEKVIVDTIFTSGSTAFSLPRYPTPKEITVDSLHIHYDPVSTQAETTFVHLRFRLKGNTFDTIMTIRGSGVQPKETVGFALSRPQSSAKAGNTTDVKVSPIRTIANKGLNEISFDLTYYGDVLGIPQVSAGRVGLSVTQGAETRTGKFATLPIKITGSNISLDSMQALASMKFFVYLSDSTATPIALSNVHLNQTDPDYERCTLSATTDSTRLQVDLLCGDSIIVEYLRGNPLPLRIVSLKPNPAQDELSIELDAAEGGVVQMEVYDELGKRVMQREVTFAKGRQQVTITTADLPEGMYSVRMGNVSGRFVKVK
jgi:photosystem II stability/assembly factor-like uncharacterized protein